MCSVKLLINTFVSPPLSYVYIQNLKTVATPVPTRTLRTKYGHFTVSSARGDHVLPAAGSHYISMFTSREESEFYSKFFAVFREF